MKFVTYRDINRGLQMVPRNLPALTEARATVGNHLKHALIANDMQGAAILALSFSDLNRWVKEYENIEAYEKFGK